MACFINVSHQSVCLDVYVASQRLGKNFTAATNTHETIEDLLDALFSMESVSYQRRVCGSICIFPYRWWATAS
jgi:hypothetical protein